MITKEKTKEIVNQFGSNEKDTGNPAVQIAILTERINNLKSHFSSNAKDHGSRRGLLQMVGQRRSHLRHLRKDNPSRYVQLLKELNLRK